MIVMKVQANGQKCTSNGGQTRCPKLLCMGPTRHPLTIFDGHEILPTQ